MVWEKKGGAYQSGASNEPCLCSPEQLKYKPEDSSLTTDIRSLRSKHYICDRKSVCMVFAFGIGSAGFGGENGLLAYLVMCQ